jgi:hypothetical protein
LIYLKFLEFVLMLSPSIPLSEADPITTNQATDLQVPVRSGMRAPFAGGGVLDQIVGNR